MNDQIAKFSACFVEWKKPTETMKFAWVDYNINLKGRLIQITGNFFMLKYKDITFSLTNHDAICLN